MEKQKISAAYVQTFAMPAAKNAASMKQSIAKNAQKPAGSVLRNAGKWQCNFRLRFKIKVIKWLSNKPLFLCCFIENVYGK